MNQPLHSQCVHMIFEAHGETYTDHIRFITDLSSVPCARESGLMQPSLNDKLRPSPVVVASASRLCMCVTMAQDTIKFVIPNNQNIFQVNKNVLNVDDFWFGLVLISTVLMTLRDTKPPCNSSSSCLLRVSGSAGQRLTVTNQTRRCYWS